MVTTPSRAFIRCGLCACVFVWAVSEPAISRVVFALTAKPQQFWVKPQDGPMGFLQAPAGALGELNNEDFDNLERDLAALLESNEQLPDGSYRLETIPRGLMDGIRARGTSEDAALAPIKRWHEAKPESPEAPIFEAMTWHALAWAARGNTYASQVNDAGMELFAVRASQAAKVLIDCKPRSGGNPLWYLAMLQTGRDLGWDRARVEPILKEGMMRFPDFHALPREMVNYLAPKWYGSYDQERAFIEKTVAAAPADRQDELYTRLYWQLQSTMDLSSSNFFAATGASWPRMKKGFDAMVARYPESLWNLNHYAAWACIANDKAVYANARGKLGATIYEDAWFPKNPTEVCDRRLAYVARGPMTLPSSDYKSMVDPRVNDGPAAHSWIGHRYAWLFETRAFGELDKSMAAASAQLSRTDDGSFHVYIADWFLEYYFTSHATSADAFEGALAQWQALAPQSTSRLIVESIYWRSMGEALRKRNRAHDDSQAGAVLFRQRLRKAQAALSAAREQRAAYPLWYTEQIRVGRDLGWSKEQLLKVYDEGIAKFPTYEPLAEHMAVSLLPMWGGSYAAVEQFAAAQASAAREQSGDERYARIYWSVNDADECVGRDYCMIFDASKASWPRMRQGFDDMMKQFPNSLWNANNYAVFACLAKDRLTYGKLRPKLGLRLFLPAWPSNASPEVCDHALLTPL